MVSAVLGDKTDAKPETMAKFLESGCMHVFAVSGMHVGVAAMLVLGMLRLLYVRPVRRGWPAFRCWRCTCL